MPRLDWRTTLRLAGAFAGAQALMPVAGWFLGSQVAHGVTSVDHWVVFVLLGAIGGKMLRDAWSGGADEPAAGSLLPGRELLVLSLATSIDALAVGISFAFLEIDTVGAAGLIGVTTLLLAVAGVLLGHRAGAQFRRPAEAVGGVVLIGIGTRILLTHLALL